MRQISCSILLVGITMVTTAAAQTVIRQPQPLDSARATLRDDLVVLRDSLNTVDGAAARLQRDYRSASEASLLSRARIMKEACARSSRTLPVARKALLGVSLTDPRKLQRRQDVVTALDSLGTALARCDTQFTAMSQPGQADSVRGYANHRAQQVQRAIRSYELHLRPFLGSMGIRIQPLGLGSNAAAR